jgi:hypothetical protein
VVSSTWLGVGLLLSLAVAYGIVSVVERLYPDKSTLPDVGSIYAHWTVLTLTLAACVNLVFATVRIPVRWDRAGAWCSHLGLIFLAVGSMVFWQTRTEGNCLIPRLQNGGWPAVRHFFQSTDEVACYVSEEQGMQPESAVQTVFDSPTGGDPVDIDMPLKGAPDGVSITAARIYPRAELRQQWSNDAAGLNPAVEIQISHGEETGRTIMCQAYEGADRFSMPECIVVFRTEEAMPQKKIDEINASTPPTSQPSREWFIIHYTGRGDPVLVTRSSSGRFGRRPLAPGQGASTAHKEHPTHIKLIRTLDRARRGARVEVPPETTAGRVSAAIELTIRSGSWSFKRIVPYDAYLSGAPTAIRVPSGGMFYVAFALRRLKLPEPIRITRHEFKTAPASRMPEDYICDMEIGSGVHVRKATLQLNFPVSVGPYRLHQSTWQPKAQSPSDYNDPSAIILGVGDRPAIWMIFVGSIALCLGFPYAFYVKPLILKSRTGRAS